jgi:predicted DNA-binding mobile mystery protein A
MICIDIFAFQCNNIITNFAFQCIKGYSVAKSKLVAQSAQARMALDSRIERMQLAAQTLVKPRGGWINTVRVALGMSSTDLARKIGIVPSTVSRLEASEIAGTINIDSLQKLADALDCDFVYALVPRQKIQTTVHLRARKIALAKLSRTQQTMALEEQAIDDLAMQMLVERKTVELAQSSTLWRENPHDAS